MCRSSPPLLSHHQLQHSSAAPPKGDKSNTHPDKSIIFRFWEQNPSLTLSSTQTAGQPEPTWGFSVLQSVLTCTSQAAEPCPLSAAGRGNRADAERSGVPQCLPQQGEEGQIQTKVLICPWHLSLSTSDAEASTLHIWLPDPPRCPLPWDHVYLQHSLRVETFNWALQRCRTLPGGREAMLGHNRATHWNVHVFTVTLQRRECKALRNGHYKYFTSFCT